MSSNYGLSRNLVGMPRVYLRFPHSAACMGLEQRLPGKFFEQPIAQQLLPHRPDSMPLEASAAQRRSICLSVTIRLVPAPRDMTHRQQQQQLLEAAYAVRA